MVEWIEHPLLILEAWGSNPGQTLAKNIELKGRGQTKKYPKLIPNIFLQISIVTLIPIFDTYTAHFPRVFMT